MVEKMGGQIKILDSKKRDKIAENLLAGQAKSSSDSWKDSHVQRILGTKLVKNSLFKSGTPGHFFLDDVFCSDLIDLLCTHPQISKFDAEMALYVTKSAQSDKIDVEKVLKFILAPSTKSENGENYE